MLYNEKKLKKGKTENRTKKGADGLRAASTTGTTARGTAERTPSGTRSSRATGTNRLARKRANPGTTGTGAPGGRKPKAIRAKAGNTAAHPHERAKRTRPERPQPRRSTTGAGRGQQARKPTAHRHPTGCHERKPGSQREQRFRTRRTGRRNRKTRRQNKHRLFAKHFLR